MVPGTCPATDDYGLSQGTKLATSAVLYTCLDSSISMLTKLVQSLPEFPVKGNNIVRHPSLLVHQGVPAIAKLTVVCYCCAGFCLGSQNVGSTLTALLHDIPVVKCHVRLLPAAAGGWTEHLTQAHLCSGAPAELQARPCRGGNGTKAF